jgi:hypothetical protein
MGDQHTNDGRDGPVAKSLVRLNHVLHCTDRVRITKKSSEAIRKVQDSVK